MASLTPAAAPSATHDTRLEGVRGLAAVGVVVYHVAFLTGVSSFIDQPPAGIGGWLTQGLAGVLPIFFILSGALLYRRFAAAVIVDEKGPELLPYFWRRVLRLLPAYWLVTITAMFLLNRPLVDGAWSLLQPLLALQFFVPQDVGLAGMGPTWTVPTELFFYLAMPVAAWLSHRWARGAQSVDARARRLLIAPIALVAVGYSWVAYTNWPTTQETVFTYNMWYWPLYYIDVLAVGMALAVLLTRAKITGRSPRLFALVRSFPMGSWLVAGAVYLLSCTRPFGIPGMADWGALHQELFGHLLQTLFAFFVILPIVVPGSESRTIRAITANPVTRYLGAISYGIYLWHDPVTYFYLKSGSIFGTQPVAGPEVRGTEPFLPMLLFVVGGTVLLATLNHFVIERNVLKLRTLFDKPAGPSSEPSMTAASPTVPAPAEPLLGAGLPIDDTSAPPVHERV